MSRLSSSGQQVAVLTLDIHHRYVHVTSRSVILLLLRWHKYITLKQHSDLEPEGQKS